MGLDVMIYTDVKPYQCPCLKKTDEIVCHWEKNGTRMAASLDYVDSNEHTDFEKVTFDNYGFSECEHKCSTREEVTLKCLDVGRISHYDHDGVFKPGQIVEYKDSDGFYFGSMGKTRMLGVAVDDYCRKKDIADPMAEMDWNEGFYTGKFLLWFKKQLSEIVHLHTQLKVYQNLLETVSEEDLVTKCMIVHC